jgi:hypothetical protein
MLHSEGNCGKSISSMPGRLFSLNSLMILEQSVLAIDPQSEETPLEGGLGAKSCPKGKINHFGYDLEEFLEGVGPMSGAVRNDCLLPRVGVGETTIMVVSGALKDQGREPKLDCPLQSDGGGSPGVFGKVVVGGEGKISVETEGNPTMRGLERKRGYISPETIVNGIRKWTPGTICDVSNRIDKTENLDRFILKAVFQKIRSVQNPLVVVETKSVGGDGFVALTLLKGSDKWIRGHTKLSLLVLIRSLIRMSNQV